MSLALRLDELGFPQASVGKALKKRPLGLNATHCWAGKLAAPTETIGYGFTPVWPVDKVTSITAWQAAVSQGWPLQSYWHTAQYVSHSHPPTPFAITVFSIGAPPICSAY